MHMDRLQIIFFGLFSGWSWVLLLATVWVTLVWLAIFRLKFRTGFMPGLLVVITIQAGLAGTAAVLTSLDSINDFSCLTGAFGVLIVPLASVVEAGLLVYLSREWPRNAAGRRDRIVGWVLIWLVFKLIVWIVLLRSAQMCTV